MCLCRWPAGLKETGGLMAPASGIKEEQAAPWGAPTVPPESTVPQLQGKWKLPDGQMVQDQARESGSGIQEGPCLSVSCSPQPPVFFLPRAGLGGVPVLFQLWPVGSSRTNHRRGRAGPLIGLHSTPVPISQMGTLGVQPQMAKCKGQVR